MDAPNSRRLAPNLMVVLRVIGAGTGEWNWQDLKEHCQREGVLQSEFDMKPLFRMGYIIERAAKDTGEPRLFITMLGQQVLDSTT